MSQFFCHLFFCPLSRSSFFLPTIFFLFHSVCFSSHFEQKLHVFLHRCIFHFDHFLDPIFCCHIFFFLSFVVLSFSLFVFHVSFYCICFLKKKHCLCYFLYLFFLLFILLILLFLFFHLFFFFFDITHIVSFSFFSLLHFSLHLFFLHLSVSLSLLFFIVSPCCCVLSFSPSLVFLSFFVSFPFSVSSSPSCPSLSHFALLPSLPLSILLVFLDLHHLFFFFITFFLNSFLDPLEIPCVS